jgi:hypothetical protein
MPSGAEKELTKVEGRLRAARVARFTGCTGYCCSAGSRVSNI